MMISVKKLPLMQTLSEAWHKVKGTKGTIAVCISLLLLITLGLSLITVFFRALPILNGIISIFVNMIYCLFLTGLIYIGIQRAFDRPIHYKQLFHAFQFQLAWKVILFYIIEALISAAMGLLLVTVIVIPFLGILLWILGCLALLYLAISLSLSIAFILDQAVNPWQAIKMSFQATQSNFFRLLFICLIKYTLLVISIIPFGLGLIWTLPFSLILYGTIYKTLRPVYQT